MNATETLARALANYLNNDLELHAARTANGLPYRIDVGKMLTAIEDAAPLTTPAPDRKICIECEGGLVRNVYWQGHDIEDRPEMYAILDWDGMAEACEGAGLDADDHERAVADTLLVALSLDGEVLTLDEAAERVAAKLAAEVQEEEAAAKKLIEG